MLKHRVGAAYDRRHRHPAGTVYDVDHTGGPAPRGKQASIGGGWEGRSLGGSDPREGHRLSHESGAKKPCSQELPGTFKRFVQRFPELAEAHEGVAQAVEKLGPLESKACQLIKIGISLGAGLESALKSHVRRARQAGATQREIEQAILLGMNTAGFPRTVAAWSWAHEQFEREARGR